MYQEGEMQVSEQYRPAEAQMNTQTYIVGLRTDIGILRSEIEVMKRRERTLINKLSWVFGVYAGFIAYLIFRQ